MDGSMVGAAGVALSALKFVYDVLKDGNLKKAERKKLEAEAKRLVDLAQISDIDKELKKHRGAWIARKKVAPKWTSKKKAAVKKRR